MGHKGLLTVIVSVFVLSASVSAWASEEDGGVVIAGKVDDIQGDLADCSVRRSGAELPLVKLASLYIGDRVSAGERCSCLLTVGGKSIDVPFGSDYAVEAVGQVPTLAGNMRSWVSGLFNGLHADKTAGTVGMVSRGGDPISPLLDRRNNYVLAGRTSLVIPWRGGKAPYAVSLFDEADNLVGGDQAVADETLRLDGLNLQDGGLYILEIRDAGGTPFTVEITALSEGELPPPPQGLSPDETLGPEARTLYSAWLASLDGGAWSLESYQRILPLSGEIYSAELLRAALEGGQRLPEAGRLALEGGTP